MHVPCLIGDFVIFLYYDGSYVIVCKVYKRFELDFEIIYKIRTYVFFNYRYIHFISLVPRAQFCTICIKIGSLYQVTLDTKF